VNSLFRVQRIESAGLLLISPRLLRVIWRVDPYGVLHIGAHEGEEDDAYRSLRWGPVTWVEAMPDNAARLRERLAEFDDRAVVTALAWNESGREMEFFLADNGMSSSVYRFGTHAVNHPTVTMKGSIVLLTERLDERLDSDSTFDLVNLDIQGAELNALKGLGKMLDSVKWIYTEVNTEEVYEGCPLLVEMDQWLSTKQFTRVDSEITRNGWGDALYVHDSLVPSHPALRTKLRKLLALFHV
jgi:FkbM family methyltransferase